MKISIIFLLFLGSVLAQYTSDHLRFAYKFTCNVKGLDKWNYQFEFKEKTSGNRAISALIQGEAQPGEISGVELCIVRRSNTQHEPFLSINHNCTDDSRTNHVNAYFVPFKIGTNGNYQVEYDLTNKAGDYQKIRADFKTDLEPFDEEVLPA